MILHINIYALHGLISHKDHTNFNHIQSSIFIKHVHKTPFTQSSAQRHYTNMQGKFQGSDRASYWASVHWMWDVSGRNQIQVMLMDEEDKGCPDKGCSDSKEMQGLPVGAFVEGELHLS
jgi:hypothetical protein